MAVTKHISEVQMKLRLSKDAQDQLAQRAASAGKEMAEIAADLIEQAVGAPVADSTRQLAALESFASGMIAWTSRHLPAGYVVDDSRERIYEGRGG